MAEAERSHSAAMGISDSRGEQNLVLADTSMETKTVSSYLCRETHPSRSCQDFSVGRLCEELPNTCSSCDVPGMRAGVGCLHPVTGETFTGVTS